MRITKWAKSSAIYQIYLSTAAGLEGEDDDEDVDDGDEEYPTITLRASDTCQVPGTGLRRLHSFIFTKIPALSFVLQMRKWRLREGW